MNARCFKVVFSKRLGQCVPVGESSVSQGKGQGARAGTALVWRLWGTWPASMVSLACLVCLPAWAQPVPTALPSGSSVAAGVATVSSSGASMAIRQGSDRAIVNWQSFNIGKEASVSIVQPGSQSVLLNRVTGESPSQIFGQLSANGQVVLVNPNGVTFGKDGSVSAAGFTASTLGISDADFMAGRMRYERNGSTAGIVHQGKIATQGGYVALLGASVDNEGRIETRGGAALLGAAESVKVPLSHTGRIKLELTPAHINASVANHRDGVIVTEGGQVYMQAAAVNSAIASVLQSGGIDTSAAQAGAVHVLADGGQIKVDGSITANSTGQDSKGLPRPGGSIVIGRDEGTGVLARQTDVSGARLESLRGFVETSGQLMQLDSAQVKAAQWLIDPYDIDITDGALTTGYTSKVSAATLGAALTGGTAITITTDASSGPASNVAVDTLGANTGTGNIRVSNAINAAGAGTLNLLADNSIDVAAAISGTGLNVNLSAGRTTATGGISLAGSINTRGGHLVVNTNKGLIEQLASMNTANATGNVTYQTQGGRIFMRLGTVLNANRVLLDNTGSTDGITSGNQFHAGSEPGIYIFNASINAGDQVTVLGRSQTGHGVQIQNSTPTGTLTKLQGKAIRIDGHGALSGALIYMNVPLTATYGDISIKAQGGSGIQDISIQDTSKLLASNGNIRLEVAKDIQLGNSTINGTGVQVTNFNGFSSKSLTLASTFGNVSITSAVDYTASGTGTYKPTLLTLQTSAGKSISQTAVGSLKVTALELLGGSADLSTAINSIGTVAAKLSSLNLTNQQAMEIGLAGASAGITATGTVAVATQTGNLSVTQAVGTSDTSTSAIVLHAGLGSTAGTVSGGDVQLGGAYAFTTGTGGRTTLYTGSTSNANLTSLLGSGSGRFRYNSDESAERYTAALGSGLYAIYREAPTYTIALNGVDKTYDGQSFSGGNGYTSSGTLLNGDGSAGIAGTLVYGGTAQGSRHAGTYNITGSGLSSSLGYALTTTDGTLNIAKANLTLAGSRTYDGTTTFAGQHLSATGVAGESFAVSGSGDASNLSSKHVADNQAVALASVTGLTLGSSGNGGLSSNYNSLSTTGSSVTLSKASATVTANSANVTYNGATQNQSAPTTSGFVTGDAITFSGAASGKNAGTYTSALQVSGSDATNYNVSITNADLTIARKDVTLAAITAASKTYDGHDRAAITGGAVAGTVEGETLAVSGTGTFDSQNAGTGKTVTVTDFTQLNPINGSGDWSNYRLTTHGALTTTASIAPKSITVSGITASDKVYDSSTAAQVNAAAARFNGMVNGDDLSVSAQGRFTDKNAGVGKEVALTSTYSGSDLGNYTITDQATATATIHKAALTLTGNSLRTPYTGQTQHVTGYTVSGLQGSDTMADLLGVLASGAFARDAGIYTNSVTADQQTNYDVTVKNGSLQIDNANPNPNPNLPRASLPAAHPPDARLPAPQITRLSLAGFGNTGAAVGQLGHRQPLAKMGATASLLACSSDEPSDDCICQDALLSDVEICQAPGARPQDKKP